MSYKFDDADMASSNNGLMTRIRAGAKRLVSRGGRELSEEVGKVSSNIYLHS